MRIQRTARYALGLTALLAAILVTLFSISDADSAVQVQTAPAVRGDLTKSVLATGTLRPVTTVEVGAQITGRVAWLGADYNSVVRKGQVIARLDASLLEAAVNQSRATLERASALAEQAHHELESAQRTYDRNQQLFAGGLIPRTDFEDVEIALSAAKANVKSADAQVTQANAALQEDLVALSRTVITAPIDGIVVDRTVDLGQTVSASIAAPTLFHIAASLDSMQVNAGIDEADIGYVRRDQSVRFHVDTYPEETFVGSISQVRIDPTLVQNVVTYSVVIDVPNRELKLRPGMTANVYIDIAARHGALLVPNAALGFRPTADMQTALQNADEVAMARRPDAANPARRPVHSAEGEELPVHSASDDVDTMFPRIEFPISEGRVWVYADGRLSPLTLRLGLSDGQMTEVVGGPVEAGRELVTKITATAG